jgi:hypothetical protein
MLDMYHNSPEDAFFFFIMGNGIATNQSWIIWEKPRGAAWVFMNAGGGGGGGGNGFTGAASAARGGGGGGSAGAMCSCLIPAWMLPDRLFCFARCWWCRSNRRHLLMR